MSADQLRQVLPGSWRIHATTFPMWLGGKRSHPTITYTPLSGAGLVLRDEVSYRTRSGATRRVLGTDRYQQNDFLWRGRGPLRVLSSRWRVVWVSEDDEVLVVTFDRSLVTPAGTDVLGRGDDDRPGLRARLAETAVLGPDQLDRLTWL
jgi:hypothetical protein